MNDSRDTTEKDAADAIDSEMITALIVLPDDESGAELHDLRRWLRDDDDLTGVAVDTVARTPVPGEMAGGDLAGLAATLLDPDLLAALLGAVGGWAAARVAGRRTRIRVKVRDNEIEIDGTGVADPESTARRLRAELDEAS